MHGVRVAEQVVQVAEDLLIRAGQKDADDVRIAVGEGVQLQALVRRPISDEALDLSVGVARDVLNRAAARRLLVEPVDRHYRKDLIDRPAVRQRLE